MSSVSSVISNSLSCYAGLRQHNKIFAFNGSGALAYFVTIAAAVVIGVAFYGLKNTILHSKTQTRMDPVVA